MPGRRTVLYRRCPDCQAVRPASEFRHATSPTNAPGQLQNRRCPACSYVGPLLVFKIAERPAEPDEGTVS